MDMSSHSSVGWTAIVGGVIGVIGFISLAIFFIVGEPFGTLNDILAIPVAFLMLPLAFALYRLNSADYSLLSLVALAAGVVGFLSTAIGSLLLITGRIGFEQSLITGIGGFGLIGLCVLLNSSMGLMNRQLPRATAWIGILLALTPSLALLAVLRAGSIARALEAMAGQTAAEFQMNPLVVVIFVLGGLSYAGMPFWFIWMGRLFATGKLSLLTEVVASR